MKTRLISAIIASCSLAGCGGGIDVDELDHAIIDAICDRYVRCGEFATRQDCVDLLEQPEAQFLELQHAIDNGTVDYDPDAMEECIDALASASCDFSARSARVDSPACFEATRGTVADGGACFISAQCISRDCNVPDCGMACCEGACGPTLAEVPIGGACNANTGDCVQDSFCNIQTQKCQALVPADGQCLLDTDCDYGLECAGEGVRRCRDMPNRGEMCSGSCADLGTFCNSVTLKCEGYARNGETCSVTIPCQGPFACDMATLKCGPPPGIGQPCIGPCAAGAFCDFSIDQCVAKRADGEMCARGEQCASGYCDELMGMCGVEPVCL